MTLKKHLTDEWELISKRPSRLLVLPRQHTVEKIINQFIEEKINRDNHNNDNDNDEENKQQVLSYLSS